MGRGQRTFKVLVADENVFFRRGLCSLFSIENGLELAGEAVSAKELPEKIREICPDLLVMNLGMVDSPEDPVLLNIRQAYPPLSILFLTQQDGPRELEKAITAGARGYMLRHSTPAQLLAGMRQALAEDQKSHSLSRTVPDLRALDASNRAYAREAVLTSREQEVMALLAEGKTVREVASELSLSVKTIEAHKLNLMRKLDIHDRASLVEYAVKKGVVAAPIN